MTNRTWTRTVGAGILALALALGAAGCGRGPAGAAPDVPSGEGAGAGPLVVGAANFQQEVLESPVPVVVDFWAAWCGPCRQIAPALEKLAAEFDGRVKVAKLNIDDERDLAARYNIRAIPAVLAFKGGEVVDDRVGVRREQEYREWFQSLL